MWKNFDFDRFFPPVYYTKEESSRMAAIMNEVQTYQQEMMLKMVMGVEPLSKWEEYKNTLRRMGIEEAQKIQQAALTRFLAR
jgi:putative aldouronate transport system substrate-binding protein